MADTPPLTVTLSTRLVARTELLSCQVGDDGTVLLDPATGTYLGLDGSAAVIWARLAHTSTVRDLCDAVLAEFEVEAEQCERDVLTFVDDLLRRNLVVPVDDRGPEGHAP